MKGFGILLVRFLPDGQEHAEHVTRVPNAAEAISVADEIERILGKLTPLEQRMFELRLEGYTLDEVAGDTRRSQRTVRRVMDRIKTEIKRDGRALS